MIRPPPRSTLFPYPTLFLSYRFNPPCLSLVKFRQKLAELDPGDRFLPRLQGALGPLVFGVEVLRSEEHTSELQSPCNLVCRLLLEKKKNDIITIAFYVIVIS